MSQEDAKALILYGEQLSARIYIVPIANGRGQMLAQGEVCDLLCQKITSRSILARLLHYDFAVGDVGAG